MAHPPFIEPQQTRSGGRCGEYRARTGWIESIEPRCIAQPDRDFRSHRQGGDDVAAAHIPLRLRDAESDGYDARSDLLPGHLTVADIERAGHSAVGPNRGLNWPLPAVTPHRRPMSPATLPPLPAHFPASGGGHPRQDPNTGLVEKHF